MGNQIVNHDTKIGTRTVDNHTVFAKGPACGINACEETLCSSFLITGCAINLACQK